MWRRKLRGKNKKGKIKYGILTAAAAAVVWLFMPFHTIKGSGEEIYVGGMPDSWPFEFYDSEKASYQGILPEILDAAAGQADMEIRYVNGSKEDNRLSLAGNMQVDAVWTMGLTDGELEAAGLHKGKAVISFQDGEERIDICLAYTKSMQSEAEEALEAALYRVNEERTEGLLVQYAKDAYQGEKNSVFAVWAAVLVLMIFILVLIIYMIKKRRQVVQLAFRDELTGGDNFTAWKKKFEEQITDGNRAHYAVLFLDAGLDTISHIYGYPESEMALQIISDICVSMLADGSEAMSRFNQFYFVFFLQYTSGGDEEPAETVFSGSPYGYLSDVRPGDRAVEDHSEGGNSG